jgi:DNA-3-methyladenine glycosylase
VAAVEAADVPAEGPLIAARRAVGRPSRAVLSRAFYRRPSLEVAPDLLGRTLVRTLRDGTRCSARIVEVEAYRQDDPASHSFRGRTARTEVMFGPPGHLYVYFTYGMHFCMNVVTGDEGEGSAVLLRAAEPLEGTDRMAARRGVGDPRLLCAGPGRLCQALAVGRPQNGTDIVRGAELRVESGSPVPPDLVVAGPRVGIRVATDRPWRFVVAGSRFVSRGPRTA